MDNLSIIRKFGDFDGEVEIPFTYDGRSLILGKSELAIMPYVKSAFSNALMNIDIITDHSIFLYTYDMMGTQTTYEMIIDEMKFLGV